MIILSDIINKINGLRFMIDKLELKSSLAKRYLLSLPFITNEQQLAKEIDNLSMMVLTISKNENADFINNLGIKLEQIHDINGTIKNLAKAATLDDIELFEIKRFCILVSEISDILENINFSNISLPNLENVIEILDPDKQRIPHFYIYSSYNKELEQLRNRYKQIQNEDLEAAEIIRQKSVELEDKIHQELSKQLFAYALFLETALNNIAYLDILLAKAQQAKDMNLCKPIIASQNTIFKSLFNPQIKALLNLQNKDFQPIDICLYQSPCLITGVNMGGKTVLLKTIALAQYLFQFGFFIPAISAEIVPVDKIMLSIGDEQSELTGLSSYASEMLNVNEIITTVKSNNRVLVLIDELARTTNPEEGKAIVNATIDILESKNIRSLITTHYSGIKSNCRKLRVKGLIAEKLSENLTINNINNFMDYSLAENNTENITMQALEIAKVLGVDNELIDRANNYLSK